MAFYEQPDFMEALGKEMGITIRCISHAADLTEGRSGADVIVVYIHQENGPEYISVLKTSVNKESDLKDDIEGWKNLGDSWLMDIIPAYGRSIPLGEGRTCAVSEFAGGKETQVQSLRKLVSGCLASGETVLEKIAQRYFKKTLEDRGRNKCEVGEIMKTMLPPDLDDKLRCFDWTMVDICPETPWMGVQRTTYPNPVHALLHRTNWPTEMPPIVVRDWIHGDLNAENIVCCGEDPVLIDFEKVCFRFPLYDLAFLFCWMVQTFYLDQCDDEDMDLEVVKNLADALGSPSGYHATADEAQLQPAINSILRPMGGLPERATEEGLVVGAKSMNVVVRIAMSMAALARGYYELREADRQKNRPSGEQNNHRRNGKFYIVLSSLVLDHEDVVPREEQVEGDAFQFPLTITPSDVETDHSSVVADRDAALELRVCSGKPEQSSFYTRLMWQIPLRTAVTATDLDLPGWRRFVQVDQYRYLSKMRIETNQELRAATEEVLVWADHNGTRLPLVFELDLNSLLPGPIIIQLQDGPKTLKLDKIDLVPINSGKIAWLGFRFRGGSCTLSEYLKWLSMRSFGELALKYSNNRSSVDFAIVWAGICEGIRQRQKPNIKAGKSSQGPNVEQPKFFQYLLSPSWPAADKPEVDDLAWRLLCSGARPTSDYPKVGLSDIIDWSADHVSHMIESRYGFVDTIGGTVLAHAAEAFNVMTKPNVFGEAEYLLWIIVKAMRDLRRSDEDIRRLARSLDGPRREFVLSLLGHS